MSETAVESLWRPLENGYSMDIAFNGRLYVGFQPVRRQRYVRR